MSKYQLETCPLCNKRFTCKVGNITQCDCATVELSRETLQYIGLVFNRCLCPSCLKRLEEQMARTRKG